MKSKLKFIIPIVLIASFGGYKFGFAKEAPKEPAKKVEGDVYVLAKDFLVNLDGGRFAKLGVALVVEHGTAVGAAATSSHDGPPEPPEGYGPLPQEALVRDIVTDVLTDSEAEELTSRAGRDEVKERIVKTIKKSTDVKIEDILFTDVAVQ